MLIFEMENIKSNNLLDYSVPLEQHAISFLQECDDGIWQVILSHRLKEYGYETSKLVLTPSGINLYLTQINGAVELNEEMLLTIIEQSIADAEIALNEQYEKAEAKERELEAKKDRLFSKFVLPAHQTSCGF